MTFAAKSLALSFTLFIALAPTAAFAQNGVAYAPGDVVTRVTLRA